MRLLIIAFSLILSSSAGGQSLSESRGKVFQKLAAKQQGEEPTELLEGVFSQAADSESVWVHLENRNTYRKWTSKLAKGSLNHDNQEIRIWLNYVSPKLSIRKGKEYNEWFKKKAMFEMNKAFRGRRLRVHYQYLRSIYRLQAMVWIGETSLNIWLVQNGLSFYLLDPDHDPPPEHQAFLQAEQYAKSQQIGLWKPAVQNTR